MEDSAFTQSDFDEVGKLSTVAASVLMKALYLARCCRFDLLHPICMLARQVTKWSRACDKRLHKLMSYLHHTREYSLEGFVGDDCKDLAVLCFSDASFADCVQTSKSTSGTFVALVGPRTFFPLNAIAKKQTCVSHSSTESEIVALDTALRVEGLPVLGFWDVVVEVMSGTWAGRGLRTPTSLPHTEPDSPGQAYTSYVNHVLDRRLDPGDDSRERRRPRPSTQLILAEDNEAVIKIVAKGRSGALRHVPRSHRISIHWLVEAFRRDGVKIRFVSTKAQIADLLTKHFTKPDLWHPLLRRAGIRPPAERASSKSSADSRASSKSSSKSHRSSNGSIKRPAMAARLKPSESERPPPTSDPSAARAVHKMANIGEAKSAVHAAQSPPSTRGRGCGEVA